MNITSDWHLHSRNSCDSAALALDDLVAQAPGLGILDFGVTDHIHTPFNLPDLVASRAEFDSAPRSPRFHFGVEVSCVSQWELDEIARGSVKDAVYGIRSGGPAGAAPAIGISEADIDRLGVEYVVAGTHWPLYVPVERESIIRNYHRQNMFLATHPLVDIVAHPWWWHGAWKDEQGNYPGDPWFDDFRRIPASMHAEFAAAAAEHGTKVEINIDAILLNPHYPERFKRQYMDYIASLRAAGVALSVGSDCHAATYEGVFAAAAAMLDDAGIREADLWVLPPRAG